MDNYQESYDVDSDYNDVDDDIDDAQGDSNRTLSTSSKSQSCQKKIIICVTMPRDTALLVMWVENIPEYIFSENDNIENFL